jgi:hypothetical protein
MNKLATLLLPLLALTAACAKPQTCSEYFECATGCSDRQCLADCGSDLPPEAAQRLSALASCVQQSGCSSDRCIAEQCPGEHGACFNPEPAGAAAAIGDPQSQPDPAPRPDAPGGPNPPQPSSELSCGAFFDCIDPCASGDGACIRACEDRLSDRGREDLDALQSCYDQNQCQDADCIRDNCSPELDRCVE